MKFISFDSGIERTGYAVFELHGSDHTIHTYGCIFTPKESSIEQRIAQLHADVEKMVLEYSPERFVIEKLFFTANKTSAIAVAQAQGTVLQLAGTHNIQVDFLTPNQIKQSITGYGNADKKSVQKMVTLLMGLDKAPEPDDTADALACGLTYCTMRSLHDREITGQNS